VRSVTHHRLRPVKTPTPKRFMKTLAKPLLALCAIVWISSAAAALPPLSLKPISVNQLQAPVNISTAGDGSGRLFICEQRGQIRILQNGMLLPTPFIDLSAKIVPFTPTTYPFPMTPSYEERGLLGLAFHPGFSNPASAGYRKFYVFYSAPSPAVAGNPNPVNCRSTLSEFQVTANPNIADAASERVLIAYDKPQSNHNGGQLEFGPDGYLYFSAGDGGGANDNGFGHSGGGSGNPSGVLGNAQDKTAWLGKIHRIDPLGTNGPGGNYGIPTSNPFFSSTNGERKEIFAYGLRNPWRFSFDTGPLGIGSLIAADVGQNKVEEINLITSGGNYGWRAKEGTFDFDAALNNALLNGGSVRSSSGLITLPGGATLTDPIAQYAHPGVTIGSPALPIFGTSVTGGYRYRGNTITALKGKYLFGDYNVGALNSGTVSALLLGIEETSPGVWSAPAAVSIVGVNPLASTHLMAFGRDEQGEIYLATERAQGPQNDTTTQQPTGGIYKVVAPDAATVRLTPAKDNTIFSEDGSLSDALGYLYAGKTGSGAGNSLRRALMAFDIASQVPTGAVITSAQLSLNLNKSSSATGNMTLNKLTQNWGEGTSNAGDPGGSGTLATPNDATWTERFYSPSHNQTWSTAGGAFSATASATTSVGFALGKYTWSSAQLATDVQGWLDSPATNFGWILLGNESTANSAKRFDSRDAYFTSQPALDISYLSAPSLTRRESWLQQYFPVGQFVDDFADPDGDGISNLLEYAYGLNPLSKDDSSTGLQATTQPTGSDTLFTITFRRDPRATDLTYMLQTSDDLVNWTTIVQSIGGADPTGSGYVSEMDSPSDSPIRIVTGAETVATGTTKRFARLKVTR
jgi:glucose/arabinose dehydrogenase